MILLNAVSNDTTGIGRRFVNPVTVFVDGDIDGGTVSIQVAREITPATGAAAAVVGSYVEVETFDAIGVKNIFVFGAYFMRAVLSGSSVPALTVATS